MCNKCLFYNPFELLLIYLGVVVIASVLFCHTPSHRKVQLGKGSAGEGSGEDLVHGKGIVKVPIFHYPVHVFRIWHGVKKESKE